MKDRQKVHCHNCIFYVPAEKMVLRVPYCRYPNMHRLPMVRADLKNKNNSCKDFKASVVYKVVSGWRAFLKVFDTPFWKLGGSIWR